MSKPIGAVDLKYGEWQADNGLVAEERSLETLAGKDGNPRLSAGDISAAAKQRENLPSIPGFLKADDIARNRNQYLQYASRYADWKNRYGRVWLTFRETPLDVNQSQSLYETFLLADKLQIPVEDFFKISRGEKFTTLSVDDKIATLRSYVYFAEASQINEKGELIAKLRGFSSTNNEITPDFAEFTAFTMQEFLDGNLVVREPKTLSDHLGGSLAGQYNNRDSFDVRASAKKDPLWQRYVTIHEAYHHYLNKTEGQAASNDEVRVHHTAMNYFVLLTSGKGFNARDVKPLFQYSFGPLPDCDQEKLDAKIERNSQELPEEIRRRYLDMAKAIIAYDSDKEKEKRCEGEFFWDKAYEASWHEIKTGKPSFQRYGTQLRQIYQRWMRQGEYGAGDILNTLNNILIVLVNYYYNMPRNHAPYPLRSLRGSGIQPNSSKNLDEVLAFYRENLSFTVPVEIPRGAYVFGEYKMPDGKIFSPSDMLTYYALSLLWYPESVEGMLPTVMEAHARAKKYELENL